MGKQNMRDTISQTVSSASQGKPPHRGTTTGTSGGTNHLYAITTRPEQENSPDVVTGLLLRISEVVYEDDIKQVPSAPDVSNYLISKDDPSAVNGKKDPLGFDPMADSEVERRLKEAMLASKSVPSQMTNLDPRLAPALQYPLSPVISQPIIQSPVVPFPAQHLPQVTSVFKSSVTQISPQDTSLQSSPAREDVRYQNLN